jgi:acyl CoA:acetate/3-ketoacid CoA transferase alpha subunit/acyl CoA:acetate/3-ketoacid CoA transferase beta subunit
VPLIGVSLADAIEEGVERGDSIHLMLGHSRWTALARELARQYWRNDAEFTLIMTSLGALGAVFFEGKMLKRVVTTYSGNSFPTYTPNPLFCEGYQSGAVQVEHWSILTLSQRLEAAARGLPGAVTGSIVDSSMQSNEAFEVVDSPFGPLGILAPLAPDVTLLHAPIADRLGNLALMPPLLEGVWGAWAARRGVIASVERIVDDVSEIVGAVKIPAHRVLAVVEAPFGAHPGGCFAPGMPVHSYGEDIAFWNDAAAAAKGDFEGWARTHLLDPPTHQAYLDLIGSQRLDWLSGRSDPTSWKEDDQAHPVVIDAPHSEWEKAASFGARELESTINEVAADAVLAGAGVANLSAWVAVARLRESGHRVQLTAELGLWGYTPTPADPYIFNHRVFPGTTILSDASTVLGLLIGGPGTRVVGCLGAAEVDRFGNLNSTMLTGGRFLVGSGGANDVASRAIACVVVTLARPERLPERVAYITSPGHRVTSVVTDKGILRRHDGELRVSAVPAGDTPLADRVRDFVAACGWDPEVLSHVEELAPVEGAEVLALREYDRERLFLR